MLRYKISTFFLGLLAIGLQTSCQKADDVQPDVLTDQIAKVETIYQGGAKMKNEYGGPKIETVADESFIKEIQRQMELNTSKQNANAKMLSTDYVGVLTHTGGCGSFSKLVIYMDCENSNPQTWVTGPYYNGIQMDYYNLRMEFCVVPNDFARMASTDYMVLNVTGTIPSDARRVTRYFDNEDGNSDNWVTLNGNFISGAYGPNYFSGNTLLEFLHYEPLSGSTASWPNWGTISIHYPYLCEGCLTYSVFGTFGSYQGNAYSDDEDRNNANYFKHYYRGSAVYTTSSIANIINVGSNTRLYMSRVF